MAAPGTSRPLRVHVDVTDTVRAHWRAGIQRVVVQLLTQLRTAGPGLGVEVVPVVWLDSAQRHRLLTEAEDASLCPAAPQDRVSGPGSSAEPSARRGSRALGAVRALPSSRALRSLRRVLRPLRRAARFVVRVTGNEERLASLRRWVRLHTVDAGLRHLVVEPAAGSVWFDMDSVWNVVEVDRSALYRCLRARGVRLAVLVYDLLPVEHPEWFEASLVEVFTEALDAQARHADVVLAISEHTAASFARWRGSQEPEPVVIPLGADVSGTTTGRAGGEALPPDLADQPYVLVVGTVEPRKNHAVLLDAFERLWLDGEPARLVVVGRPGWNNDDVLARLRAHPELGRRLRWFDEADDDVLEALYERAALVAVPSVTEGFGLPVIEALAHRVPVLSSEGGALPEAGGALVDHVDHADTDRWTAELRSLLHDEARRASRIASLADYRPPTWDDCARSVASVLRHEHLEQNS